MKDEYDCILCGDRWVFCSEDYEDTEDWPKICPFCNMPKTQLFRDVYKEAGFWEAIKEVWKRI
jgi:hypothetical protein